MIASHPLPVRVDMALDQPPAERAEQVSYLVLTSAIYIVLIRTY